MNLVTFALIAGPLSFASVFGLLFIAHLRLRARRRRVQRLAYVDIPPYYKRAVGKSLRSGG